MPATHPPRGRPRAFDRDQALARATRMFWRQGYEATSMRDLSTELGIGQPSLYAAFGSKRALFEEAVGHYEHTDGHFIAVALTQEPTAARALRRILKEAPTQYTRRGLPRGCLLVSGDSGTDDADVRTWLTDVRGKTTRMIADRISQDVASGLLPASTDAAALATYLMTVLNGMAHHARNGLSRRDLTAVARLAACALPPDDERRRLDQLPPAFGSRY